MTGLFFIFICPPTNSLISFFILFDNKFSKYGNKSFSTSIVKKLEEACNENLRASGFPSQLKDNQSNKKGIEIKF